MTTAQWNTYRQQTDPPADAVVERIAQAQGTRGLSAFMRWLADTHDWSLDQQDPSVREFWGQYRSLPIWADTSQINQGVAFFRAHQATIGLLLGCLSLPYCYAAADGAQVLYLSERIGKDTRKRLEETGEFVFGIMKQSAWRRGEAVGRILKVRLMHAAVRYFTLHSGKWQAAWGQPINQEDMAGTNLAFGYIVLRGMRKSGQSPDDQAAQSYLHLWRVIGHLMGVSEELLPVSLHEAYRIDRAIAKRQFRPSEAGRALAKSLRLALESFVPNPAFRSIPTAHMRFLLGDALADLLDLPAVPIAKRLVPFLPTSLFFANPQ